MIKYYVIHKTTVFNYRFFYTYYGDIMKIYLDLIFLLNFSFDFILLLTVSIILKRNVKIIRLILGSIIGSLSTFLLFLDLNNIELFLYKLFISIVMLLITFKYKNIKYTLKNMEYLYITSIILGGFLYLLNLEFSYKNEGIIFYHNGLSVNFIFLIILSPIILYLYIKQVKELKNNYSYYHKLNIYYKDKIIKINSYLDTGNKLKDPYLSRPIIIINNKLIEDKYLDDYILVPMDTINSHSMLKCIKVDKIEIDGKELKKNVLIGLSPKKIKMEGIDSIIGKSILEG